MDKKVITKKVVSIVVGISAGYVISSIIQNNTTAVTIPQKVKASVGGYVLGAMVADAAQTWTDGKVDAIFDWCSELTHKTPTK